jgi:alpha-glucosidase
MIFSRCHAMSLGLLFVFGSASAFASEAETINSPNGKVEVTVRQVDEGLVYSVRLDGRDVLVDAPLGLTFQRGRALAPGVTIESVTRGGGNATWKSVCGKRSEVVDHYQEMTLHLKEADEDSDELALVFRAYDDGAAFRYVVPEAWGEFELQTEQTGFRFPSDATVWAADFGGFHSPQESEFVRQPVSRLKPEPVYGCPLLARVSPNTWAAITEANLTDWAGMHFARSQDDPHQASAVLSPDPEDPSIAVRSAGLRHSPWRVIMLAERPAELVESDLVRNLNDPPSGDFSWVKPGKSTWDIWWSGEYAPEVDFELGMNTESMKYFVDLAPELGATYQLVDDGWYGESFAPGARMTTWAGNPEADLTRVIPEVDMPGLIAYARERGVRIILWMHWQTVDAQMDEAFAEFEKWGVAGVKIDFMDRDDQYVVNFYRRVAEKAAEHHLVVDFHGAYKPTGVSRTYPNLIVREGVLGNEYNKWSARITPGHTVTIPFTRGLLGEMDFTPGGFRQKTVETFRPQNSAPFVMGTRAHQLAMFVVYESPLTVICDSPYNYRSSPAGTDFIKEVPTTWDDTRCIHGEVGDFITVARRAADTWFVGSMTDENRRTLEIPLDFLGPGDYQAQIWADAYEAADYPDRLMKSTRTVTADDTLTAVLAPGGGHVMQIAPLR